MRIDFTEEALATLPAAEASLLHKNLFNKYLNCDKLRFHHERNLIKFLGVFVAAIILLFFWVTKGLTPNYLLGVVLLGAMVIAYYAFNLRVMIRNDKEVSHVRKRGVLVEKACSQVISSRTFHRFESLSKMLYRCALFQRLFPFNIVAIATGTAAFFLLDVSQWLQFSIGSIAVSALVTLNYLIGRSIKSAFLK